MRVILASKSPRRKEILSMLGIDFTVMSADADESSSLSDPHELVRELSLRKGRALREQLMQSGDWDDDTLIIAADTVVATKEEILGKPKDDADTRRMLSLLSGTEHTVVSGIALLIGDKEDADTDETAVSFAPMSSDEIDWYVASGEPADKAGAYAVQGLASLFIRGLRGDYFNVVGLPVHQFHLALHRLLGFGADVLAEKSKK
jgi:septum formation protein